LQDLAISIRASAPRLQKMIQEEADDEEAVAKLLELSSTINADLEKYDKLRKGDFEGASQVTVKSMYTIPY
jgi:ADP-ribosylation factor-binding protein GGA